MSRPSYRTLLASLLPFLLTNALRADVVISEILYDSEPNAACDEFIELHNSGTGEVDLSGWYFSDGIEFVVPAGTALASSVDPIIFDALGRARDATLAVSDATVSVGGTSITVVGETGFAFDPAS